MRLAAACEHRTFAFAADVPNSRCRLPKRCRTNSRNPRCQASAGNNEVCVLGAGVIGLSVALQLRQVQGMPQPHSNKRSLWHLYMSYVSFHMSLVINHHHAEAS